MEFEISNGRLRYSNFQYKRDKMIRKEIHLSAGVVEEVKRIIADCQVTKEDDKNWPESNREDGRQELEIRMGKEHIVFESAKIGSLLDVQSCEDPDGFSVFYYLVQDLRCLVFSLITLHFKIKPIP